MRQHEKYIIERDAILRLLHKYLNEKTVIAPKKSEPLEEILLLEITDPGQVCLDFTKTLNSTKDYLLPHCESLFTFSKYEKIKIHENKDEEKFVFFGIRPCDTKAVMLLDKFFSRNIPDTPYLRKRQSSLFYTLACPQCWENCFCNCLGAGPILEQGFDFQLIAIDDDKFLVELDSKEARAELEKIKGFLSPADKNAILKVRRKRESFQRCPEEFQIDVVKRKLKDGKVSSQIWKDIARRCQMCGLCLFLCPTCSCFTVQDHIVDDGIYERQRQWDACYFLGFTRLAGGENPVESKEEMVKRKYYHKLYQQIAEFDLPGCTGCGRCIDCCVGNVNWLENIKRIMQNV